MRGVELPESAAVSPAAAPGAEAGESASLICFLSSAAPAPDTADTEDMTSWSSSSLTVTVSPAPAPAVSFATAVSMWQCAPGAVSVHAAVSAHVGSAVSGTGDTCHGDSASCSRSSLMDWMEPRRDPATDPRRDPKEFRRDAEAILAFSSSAMELRRLAGAEPVSR